MIGRSLDVDAVRAFIRIADTGSFTRAAETMQTTQSAISLKLKRLEARLGVRLLERTPRYVQLSRDGAAFLARGRELVEAHDRIFFAVGTARQRLSIGISDHIAGPELPALIGRINAHDPSLVVEVRIGSSDDLLQGFDRRELDVAIVRFRTGRDDGEVIAEERFSWFAGSGWQPRSEEPLPVATMPEPCGVRTLAGELLDAAGISWAEVFVGGGVAAVSAAVTAKLGVAAMAQRMLPLGAVDVGQKLDLPALPRLPIVLHSRVASDREAEVVGVLAAALASAARN